MPSVPLNFSADVTAQDMERNEKRKAKEMTEQQQHLARMQDKENALIKRNENFGVSSMKMGALPLKCLNLKFELLISEVNNKNLLITLIHQLTWFYYVKFEGRRLDQIIELFGFFLVGCSKFLVPYFRLEKILKSVSAEPSESFDLKFCSGFQFLFKYCVSLTLRPLIFKDISKNRFLPNIVCFPVTLSISVFNCS